MKRTRSQRKSLPEAKAEKGEQAVAAGVAVDDREDDVKDEGMAAEPRMTKKVRTVGLSVEEEADVQSIVWAIVAKPEWTRKLQDATIVQRWTAEAEQQGASPACIAAAFARLRQRAASPEAAGQGGGQPNDGLLMMVVPVPSSSVSEAPDDQGDGGEGVEAVQPANEGGYSEHHSILHIPRGEGESVWSGWPEEDDYRVEEDYMTSWTRKEGRFERTETRVAYIDGLVPERLRERLEAGLDAIANVPDDQKDFHPGSDGKVQDLVHPSLYPCIRGISYPADDTEAGSRMEDHHRGEDEDEEEDEFGWVEEYGGDPETEKKYSRMWEESRDIDAKSIYQWLPAEFAVNADGRAKIISYINNLDRRAHPKLYEDIANVFSLFVPLFEVVLPGLQLKGKQLQVIVKAANYVLQPGQEYEGSWHVEGMSHEHILASGIYYYSVSSNLTSSSNGGGALAFREMRSSDSGRTYSQNYSYNVNLGKVDTPEGRCLVFTNVLQHKVKELSNESDQVGVRKILCFFLVHPSVRIRSSADIPEQQWDARKRDLTMALLLSAAKAGCPRLPPELVSMIMNKAKWGLTHEEALEHRKALMTERKYWVDLNNRLWERPYSFCEH